MAIFRELFFAMLQLMCNLEGTNFTYMIKIKINILKILKTSLYYIKLYYVDTDVFFCGQTSVFNFSSNEIVPEYS